jgi:hypothetical protein
MSYDPGLEQRPAKPIDLRQAVLSTGITAVYPDANTGSGLALLYLAAALAGEAGETSNQLKKVLRDDAGVLTEKRRARIKKELGGVMWYWLRVCYETGLDPYEVIEANLALVKERQATGTLHGDDEGEGRVGVPQGRRSLFSDPEERWDTAEEALASGLVGVEPSEEGEWRVTCAGKSCSAAQEKWVPSVKTEPQAILLAAMHVQQHHVVGGF